MKAEHPFALLGPLFALTAFAATAIVALKQGADCVRLVLNPIIAFLAVHFVGRKCAQFLAALPASDRPASHSAPEEHRPERAEE
jgi:hypothetical protein